MIAPNDWDLSTEVEYAVARPQTSQRDDSANNPVSLEAPIYPIEGRAIILHILVAVLLPCVFFVGELLHRTGYLPELIVGSILLGFAVGLKNYVTETRLRAMVAERTPGLRATDLPPMPSFLRSAIAPSVILPVIVTAVAVYAVWSENHFVAIALPAFLCLCAFGTLGRHPVVFWQEYYLAQPEIDPQRRHKAPRFDGMPDLKLLVTILFVLLTAPILLSSSWTFLILAIVVSFSTMAKLGRLRHNDPRALLGYLLHRSHHLLHVYLDYRDVFQGEEREQWVPPSSRVERFLVFVQLLSILFVVLLTGLTYYCPWEFFGDLFVPTFESSYYVVPANAPIGYQWLLEPLRIAFEARPVAGYLLTFVAAIIGSMFFPAAILFAIYFEKIVAIEVIHQESKAVRRSYM